MGTALYSFGAVMLHFGLKECWQVRSKFGRCNAKDMTERVVGHLGSQSAF